MLDHSVAGRTGCSHHSIRCCRALDYCGGCLVLWYYDGADWGRRVFAVFNYKDKVLKRLKNSFPPFSEFVDKVYSSDWDSMAKLSGTEVVYFKQDCWPTKFDADGFTMSLGGMEETIYKFDGNGFVKEE